MKSNQARLPTAPILLNGINWSLRLVHQVWVENIEFVSLHNLWRWVIMIIVSLIVFVPLISSMNTVEVLWLPRSVLVMPPVHLQSTFYMFRKI